MRRRVPTFAVCLSLALGLSACAYSDSQTWVSAELGSEQQREVFHFTDPTAWRCVDDDAMPGGCLELYKEASEVVYSPPHRSPLSVAVLRGLYFGDFEMRLRARQTGREYPHRDLVLVFAYRDPAHFAYAHLATRGDDNAHQVMLVDGADRAPVTTTRTQGVDWGDGWHDLRLLRRGTRVEVWFDEGDAPALVGEVPVGEGLIGFGSFDDTGRFARLRAHSL